MPISRYPAGICLAALILGIFLGARFEGHPFLWLGLGAGALGLSFLTLSRQKIFLLTLFITLTLTGTFLYSTSPQKLHARVWDGIHGHVKDKPFVLSGVISRNLYKGQTRFGQSYRRFQISDIRTPDQRPLPGSLLVYAPGSGSDYHYGDRVEMTGVLHKAREAGNPASFDESRYLFGQDVHAVMRAQDMRFLKGGSEGARGWIYSVKNHLIRYLDTLDEFSRGVAKAIFLGERSDLDPDFRQQLVQTGTMHLFAISGLHVGLVSAFLYLILSSFGLSPKWKSLILIPLLVFYCALTGHQTPILRATIMACVYLGGRFLSRDASSLNSLALAGGLILFFNPNELFSIGFQLSFGTVFGLLVVMPRFFSIESVRALRSGQRIRIWTTYAMSLCVLSLVAWMVSGPIVIHYFHRLNFLAPMLNVMLVPAAFILLALIIVFCGLSFLPMPMLDPIRIMIERLIAVMNGLVAGYDAHPEASRTLSSWSWGIWALFLGFFSVCLYAKWIKSSRIRLCILTLVFLNCIFLNQVFAQRPLREHRVTFFDVGQGDSVLVEAVPYGCLVVDTGRGRGKNSRADALITYLQSKGIGRIDVLVLTHPEYDHAGAAADILSRTEVGLILDNGVDKDADFHRELRKEISKKGIKRLRVQSNDIIHGIGGAKIRVLHPGNTEHERNRTNDDSVVLAVKMGDQDILLTGDLEETGLGQLMAHHDLSGTEILKVPHHGAKIGPKGLALLRESRPEVSVISVGLKNRYGHPDAETLEALGELSEEIYRTDQRGAVQIRIPVRGGRVIKTVLRDTN